MVTLSKIFPSWEGSIHKKYKQIIRYASLISFLYTHFFMLLTCLYFSSWKMLYVNDILYEIYPNIKIAIVVKSPKFHWSKAVIIWMTRNFTKNKLLPFDLPCFFEEVTFFTWTVSVAALPFTSHRTWPQTLWLRSSFYTLTDHHSFSMQSWLLTLKKGKIKSVLLQGWYISMELFSDDQKG